MVEPNSKIFPDSVVFALSAGERFSIIPEHYLDFGKADATASNLVMADFELVSGDISRKVGDGVFVNAIVELRDFLAGAESAKIGETLEFTSEEKVVAMRFTRQDATLRISGKTPTDEYPSACYSDFQSRLEREFETQVTFYCNFPIDKIPAVVEQLNSILQVIEYEGPGRTSASE